MTLSFKSCYLRNSEIIAVLGSGSSDGLIQITLKTLWKRFAILHVIETISKSWKRDQVPILEFEKICFQSSCNPSTAWIKTPVEEVTSLGKKIGIELGLEEHEDANE